MQAIDEELPILSLKTMREHRDQSLEFWMIQAGASVFTVFGLVALTLAVVGLYGVKAFMVSQRTREFGIRMAMGATRADVLRLILKEGAALAAVGLAVGIALSLAAGQLLSRILVQVSATDPLAFLGSITALSVAALIATYLPGRRATRVPPAHALHYE